MCDKVHEQNKTMPMPQYVELRLPDGTHSGVRVDRSRLVLEVQRKGVKYYFDLTLPEQNTDKCANTLLTVR